MKTALLLVLLAACTRDSDRYCSDTGAGFQTGACSEDGGHDDAGSDGGPDAFACAPRGKEDPTQCMDATTPVCSAAGDACVACTQDSDCTSQVCFRETGECANDTTTAFVNPQFGGSPSDTCVQAAPCTSMAIALAVGKNHYYLLGNVTEFVEFTTDAVIAGAANVGIAAGTNTSHPAALLVTGGTLAVSDLGLVASGVNGGSGLQVANGASARAVRVRFGGSVNQDVKSGGTVTINNCEFSDNHGLAIVVTGGMYTVTNSLFTMQNLGSVSQPPVQLAGGGTFEFNTMSTYAVNAGARAKGVECSGGGTVAYNLIAGQLGTGTGPSITAGTCTVHTNVVDLRDGTDMNTMAIGPQFGSASDETKWIPLATSQAINAAVGATISGDLSIDHLLHPRPAGGSNADIGAFENQTH